MESFINTVNGIVWSPALVYLCLGAGLFLSLRGGFLQLRHLKHMWQLLFQPKDNVTGVSSFQALSMTCLLYTSFPDCRHHHSCCRLG